MAHDNDVITRYEFDVLKDDVRELHKIYDIVNRQTIATEKLALEMKFMREKQDNTVNEVNDISSRVKNLEEKPVKRYDTVVNNIITTIIGLILGVIATIIGLKK